MNKVISVSARDSDPESTLFWKDDGPGLPPEEKEWIFGRLNVIKTLSGNL